MTWKTMCFEGLRKFNVDGLDGMLDVEFVLRGGMRRGRDCETREGSGIQSPDGVLLVHR
jgi:hypothetical protein